MDGWMEEMWSRALEQGTQGGNGVTTLEVLKQCVDRALGHMV